MGTNKPRERKAAAGTAGESAETTESRWRNWLTLLLGVPAAAGAIVAVVASLHTPAGLNIASMTLNNTYRPTLRVVLQNGDDMPAVVTRATLVFESAKATTSDQHASAELRTAPYTWLISASDVARRASTRPLKARIEKKEPDVLEFVLGFEQRHAVLTGTAYLELSYNDGRTAKSQPFELRIENGPGDYPEFRFPDNDAELVVALHGTDAPFEITQIIGELTKRRVVVASPDVQQYFSSPDTSVRVAAAEYFTQVRDPAAAQSLSSLAEATEPSVRRASLRALEAQGAAAFGVIERLMSSKDPTVRDGMAVICGRLRDERCLEPLRGALDDRGVAKIVDGGEVLVAAAAVRALATFGKPEDVDRIIRKLADDNESVQLAAVNAIGDLQLRRAIPALKKLATTGRPAVKEEATAMLATLRQRNPTAGPSSIAGATR